MAFRQPERRRERAIGKQPFANAQRYRVDHQPEGIDQISFDQRLQKMRQAVLDSWAQSKLLLRQLAQQQIETLGASAAAATSPGTAAA